jgi:sulfur-oxidizing protein SoxX
MLVKQVSGKMASFALFCCISMLGGMSVASADAIADGKKVAFDRKKGNCMTCHIMVGATLAGNIGPPLVAMKARFPDKAKLRSQIWDATAKNPNTMMPPFGLHRILSEKEIDLVTVYIYSL